MQTGSGGALVTAAAAKDAAAKSGKAVAATIAAAVSAQALALAAENACPCSGWHHRLARNRMDTEVSFI